ncbi:hypothetical protein GCM10023175_28950 [Pseudonocardia xishanensis]|uniref:Uncharacterized protein n=1 Tax=Pseudonocardia xishanensis TaxID=630995 RepID=A0ABP8RT37_9PSEU
MSHPYVLKVASGAAFAGPHVRHHVPDPLGVRPNTLAAMDDPGPEDDVLPLDVAVQEFQYSFGVVGVPRRKPAGGEVLQKSSSTGSMTVPPRRDTGVSLGTRRFLQQASRD